MIAGSPQGRAASTEVLAGRTGPVSGASVSPWTSASTGRSPLRAGSSRPSRRESDTASGRSAAWLHPGVGAAADGAAFWWTGSFLTHLRQSCAPPHWQPDRTSSSVTRRLPGSGDSTSWDQQTLHFLGPADLVNRRLPGIQVHPSSLGCDDAVRVEGIWCTPAARTACDVVRLTPPVDGLATLDAARAPGPVRPRTWPTPRGHRQDFGR
jgi:hypothetical protein